MFYYYVFNISIADIHFILFHTVVTLQIFYYLSYNLRHNLPLSQAQWCLKGPCLSLSTSFRLIFVLAHAHTVAYILSFQTYSFSAISLYTFVSFNFWHDYICHTHSLGYAVEKNAIPNFNRFQTFSFSVVDHFSPIPFFKSSFNSILFSPFSSFPLSILYSIISSCK